MIFFFFFVVLFFFSQNQAIAHSFLFVKGRDEGVLCIFSLIKELPPEVG